MKKFLLVLSFLFFSLFSSAQTTSAQLKEQIDTDITNKSGANSITKVNVGGNLKAVVDYVVQEVATITSRTINGQSLTANISLTKANIGLTNVDNTADNAKPVSTAQASAIAVAARPYKSYAAVITQSGSTAPTALILENGFSGTPAFAYMTTGYYTLTLTGAFVTDKVLILTGPSDAGERVRITRTNANSLTFEAFGTGGAAANGVISNFPIEIRVYN